MTPTEALEYIVNYLEAWREGKRSGLRTLETCHYPGVEADREANQNVIADYSVLINIARCGIGIRKPRRKPKK